MIAVIDYGMGNLRSVQKALELVGAKTRVTSSPRDIERAEKVVFPGVGAFGDSMRELKRRKLVMPIKESIASGRPFLGLCLGMQLLFESSEEAPGVEGLGVMRGRVKRFRFLKDEGRRMKDALKIPHMGWNTISRPSSFVPRPSSLLKGIDDGTYMYFVHSYYVIPKDPEVVLTVTDYGFDFASGVEKGNIFGLQFHPEKSQEVGIRMLRNFVKI